MQGEIRPGYKLTEVGVIPADWEVKPLPSVLDFISGKAHEQHIRPYGEYVVVNSKFISSDGQVAKHSDHNFCPARRGDILMVMSDLPNGKALAKCFVVDRDQAYAVNQRICILRPKKSDSHFFFYQLNRNPYFMAFDDGVQQTHLLNGVFRACPVIVPPTIEEQRAIAAALADADALIAALEGMIAKKRDLKQAAMQHLLTGKTRLPGFSGAWQFKQLGDVVSIQKGQLMTAAHLVPGDVPVIAGGKQPAYHHANFNRKGPVVTVSASGASAGYVSYHGRSIFASDCSTISEGAGYDLRYIYFSLLLKQDEIYRAQTGGAQPHIHAKDIAPMRIAFPPTSTEQATIADVLSDMDADLAALRLRVAKARDLKQGLMQQLLTGRVRLV